MGWIGLDWIRLDWFHIEYGFDLKKAILASDAFFPFSDSIESANEYGI